MRRLTESDWTWGPITCGRWNSTIQLRIAGGDQEYPDSNDYVQVTAFGWVLRLALPWKMFKPVGESWEYLETEYGFSLSASDNGYDFLQVFYGPQTHSSATTKRWSWFLPWKEWRHVRTSYFDETGQHFYTAMSGASWEEERQQYEACPTRCFALRDYDGTRIVATTRIEEREWHRGRGWFRWLSWFYAPFVRRDLNIEFDQEVGPQKGSWKGGTLATGTSIKPGETHEMAFRRFCEQDHKAKGRSYRLTYDGPCAPPAPKFPRVVQEVRA